MNEHLFAAIVFHHKGQPRTLTNGVLTRNLIFFSSFYQNKKLDIITIATTRQFHIPPAIPSLIIFTVDISAL